MILILRQYDANSTAAFLFLALISMPHIYVDTGSRSGRLSDERFRILTDLFDLLQGFVHAANQLTVQLNQFITHREANIVERTLHQLMDRFCLALDLQQILHELILALSERLKMKCC